MKFECNAWLEVVPVMSATREVIGARIESIYKRPHEGTIKLCISVPESFFNAPEIRVSFKERDPEIWEGAEV